MGVILKDQPTITSTAAYASDMLPSLVARFWYLILYGLQPRWYFRHGGYIGNTEQALLHKTPRKYANKYLIHTFIPGPYPIPPLYRSN